MLSGYVRLECLVVSFESRQDVGERDLGIVRVIEMSVALEQVETVLSTFTAGAEADQHVDVGDVLRAGESVSTREEMADKLVQ